MCNWSASACGSAWRGRLTAGRVCNVEPEGRRELSTGKSSLQGLPCRATPAMPLLCGRRQTSATPSLSPNTPLPTLSIGATRTSRAETSSVKRKERDGADPGLQGHFSPPSGLSQRGEPPGLDPPRWGRHGPGRTARPGPGRRGEKSPCGLGLVTLQAGLVSLVPSWPRSTPCRFCMRRRKMN